MTAVLSTAFLDKVATETDCHIWTGAVNSKGYGCFGIDGVSHLAHRVAWETLRNPIPDGLTIDHLCRVRNCVNVEHMELVTPGENLRRARWSAGYFVGGRCVKGHQLGEDTIYRRPDGGMECRTCIRGRKAARRLVAVS